MDKLQALICKGCGGHIDRETLECRSCGTAYRLDNDYMPVPIVLNKANTVTLSSQVFVPREYMLDASEVAEYSLHEMAQQMAKNIMPLIEYTTEFDIRHNQYVTHGRLRVYDPHRR